ncbi:MAG: hypothetical protein LC118_05390 [Dehalococcoidia bacterium]|nr:hypothetical protein [Dehalococcoidia bacterium]
MTARQPRRARRRSAPATTLPRPSAVAPDSDDAIEAGDTFATPTARRSTRRTQFRHREHHVEKDYSYVHKDLLAVLGIGIVCIAFILGMSFFVG